MGSDNSKLFYRNIFDNRKKKYDGDCRNLKRDIFRKEQCSMKINCPKCNYKLENITGKVSSSVKLTFHQKQYTNNRKCHRHCFSKYHTVERMNFNKNSNQTDTTSYSTLSSGTKNFDSCVDLKLKMRSSMKITSKSSPFAENDSTYSEPNNHLNNNRKPVENYLHNRIESKSKINFSKIIRKFHQSRNLNQYYSYDSTDTTNSIINNRIDKANDKPTCYDDFINTSDNISTQNFCQSFSEKQRKKNMQLIPIHKTSSKAKIFSKFVHKRSRIHADNSTKTGTSCVKSSSVKESTIDSFESSTKFFNKHCFKNHCDKLHCSKYFSNLHQISSIINFVEHKKNVRNRFICPKKRFYWNKKVNNSYQSDKLDQDCIKEMIVSNKDGFQTDAIHPDVTNVYLMNAPCQCTESEGRKMKNSCQKYFSSTEKTNLHSDNIQQRQTEDKILYEDRPFYSCSSCGTLCGGIGYSSTILRDSKNIGQKNGNNIRRKKESSIISMNSVLQDEYIYKQKYNENNICKEKGILEISTNSVKQNEYIHKLRYDYKNICTKEEKVKILINSVEQNNNFHKQGINNNIYKEKENLKIPISFEKLDANGFNKNPMDNVVETPVNQRRINCGCMTRKIANSPVCTNNNKKLDDCLLTRYDYFECDKRQKLVDSSSSSTSFDSPVIDFTQKEIDTTSLSSECETTLQGLATATLCSSSSSSSSYDSDVVVQHCPIKSTESSTSSFDSETTVPRQKWKCKKKFGRCCCHQQYVQRNCAEKMREKSCFQLQSNSEKNCLTSKPPICGKPLDKPLLPKRPTIRNSSYSCENTENQFQPDLLPKNYQSHSTIKEENPKVNEKQKNISLSLEQSNHNPFVKEESTKYNCGRNFNNVKRNEETKEYFSSNRKSELPPSKSKSPATSVYTSTQENTTYNSGFSKENSTQTNTYYCYMVEPIFNSELKYTYSDKKQYILSPVDSFISTDDAPKQLRACSCNCSVVREKPRISSKIVHNSNNYTNESNSEYSSGRKFTSSEDTSSVSGEVAAVCSCGETRVKAVLSYNVFLADSNELIKCTNTSVEDYIYPTEEFDEHTPKKNDLTKENIISDDKVYEKNLDEKAEKLEETYKSKIEQKSDVCSCTFILSENDTSQKIQPTLSAIPSPSKKSNSTISLPACPFEEQHDVNETEETICRECSCSPCDSEDKVNADNDATETLEIESLKQTTMIESIPEVFETIVEMPSSKSNMAIDKSLPDVSNEVSMDKQTLEPEIKKEPSKSDIILPSVSDKPQISKSIQALIKSNIPVPVKNRIRFFENDKIDKAKANKVVDCAKPIRPTPKQTCKPLKPACTVQNQENKAKPSARNKSCYPPSTSTNRCKTQTTYMHTSANIAKIHLKGTKPRSFNRTNKTNFKPVHRRHNCVVGAQMPSWIVTNKCVADSTFNNRRYFPYLEPCGSYKIASVSEVSL